MSKKLSFKEALERPEQGQTAFHPRSAFPAVKVHLRRTSPIRRPVDLARQFVSYGLSLRKAHEALNRLTEGETVALELACPDFDQSVDRLAEMGIDARRVSMPVVDPRHVRESYGLTQTEFADRFLLNVDTIRNWEQGRNAPDPSARLLLKLIEEYPQVVEAVLSGFLAFQQGTYQLTLNQGTFQTQVAVQNYADIVANIVKVWGEVAAAHLEATLNTRIEIKAHSWIVGSN
jgi:DNA-binding transcriptional regulator YiaG